MRIAILGPGRIADQALAPAIRAIPGVRLRSVLSRDPGRARDFAERHGADRALSDLEELLSDGELDAVLIATPDRLHAPQGIAAARAGKHVLVEKPMAAEAGEARELVEACRKAGVRLGVAYHLRWHAGHRELMRRVHAGELGELRHIRAHWTFKAADATNWRARSEVGRWWGLAGVGTHALDLVRWAMVPSCGEVTEVRSVITREVFKGPHDENALLALRFESGATAEIFTSVLFNSRPRVEIYGSTGSAICDGTLGAHGKGDILLNGAPLAYVPADPYQGEIADFVDAVREGRNPEVPGEEGLRNVEILVSTVQPG